MKIGYSLLLSEYLNAASIEYQDCKNFQIICPSCKEPVFKVVRKSIEEPLHYLSHYEKDKSYVDECELRVSAIHRDEILKNNVIARDQRLRYFLNVLQETIFHREYKDYQKAKKTLKRVAHTKVLDRYRQLMHKHAKKVFSKNNEQDILEFFESYIDEIKEIGGEFYKTSFSIEQQKRIALDIWYHILSPKAKENYFFLVNHGYTMLMSRIKLAEQERQLFDYEIDMHNIMDKILFSSKEKGYLLFEKLNEYKITKQYSWGTDNLYDKMSAEITHEIFGCLLRLPYFELLKDAVNKKSFSTINSSNT